MFIKDALNTHRLRACPTKVVDILLGMTATCNLTDIIKLVIEHSELGGGARSGSAFLLKIRVTCYEFEQLLVLVELL